MRQTQNDEELVLAAMRGEVRAREALYRRYAQRAYATALRLLSDHELARDAVQNAFMMAFRRLGSLRSPQAWLTWFDTIVVHEAINLRRRHKRHIAAKTIIDVETLAGEGASLEERVLFARCQEWLNNVREPDRTIYMLRVFESREHAEIAQLVGLSVATIKRKLARVEGHLRSLGAGADHD